MEATLSAYQPTWRDRLARALMGDERASPVRRTLVEGLMGSSGLGTTGAGLVDFTPAGIPLAAQEARNDAMSGNYVGATLGAMAVMPAAKPGVKAVQQGIRAYHGSPHDFDKFDLSKIGTGEGAQAYGHGLYFAESDKVAREYRDRLSDGMSSRPRWFLQGQEAAPGSPEAKAASIINELGPAKARKFAQETVAQFSADPRMTRELEFWKGVSGVLEQPLTKRDVSQKFGHMYEVNIKADPDAFLDWDKPLREQPQSAVRALQQRGIVNMDENIGPSSAGVIRPLGWAENVGTMSGEKFYRRMIENQMQGMDRKGGERAATQALREAGIPGIKYLDQGSRAAGDGSRNYVVFDDALIEILRKYGLTGLLGLGAVGGAYQSQTQEGGT